MPHPDTSLSPRDLAAAIGVSESSLKRWVDSGLLTASRTTGGHRRIALREAIRFIRKSKSPIVQPDLLGIPGASVPASRSASVDPGADLCSALFRDDAREARAIILGRYLAGDGVAAIGDALIGPALNRVGDAWREGPQAILMEHRAVDTCVHVLHELRSLLPVPAADAPAAMSAAGPGDPYMIPPALASLTLLEAGYQANNVGPLTPMPVLHQGLVRYRPRILTLSVSAPEHGIDCPGLIDLARSMTAAGGHLLIGGRCVRALPAKARPYLIETASMAELGAFARGALSAAAR